MKLIKVKSKRKDQSSLNDNRPTKSNNSSRYDGSLHFALSHTSHSLNRKINCVLKTSHTNTHLSVIEVELSQYGGALQSHSDVKATAENQMRAECVTN